MMHVPSISEVSGTEKRTCDIFSRLLEDRIILLNGEINDDIVPVICLQLLFLDAQDSSKPIYIYINSPGGSITSGLAIYDTMLFIAAPVCTVCIGLAASIGAFLLASGSTGKRFSLPHAEIMIHQPSGGCMGQATDIEIHARQIRYYKQILNELLAEHTGRNNQEIEQMTERDRFLTPQEAKDIGIIDGILCNRESLHNLH